MKDDCGEIDYLVVATTANMPYRQMGESSWAVAATLHVLRPWSILRTLRVYIVALLILPQHLLIPLVAGMGQIWDEFPDVP